MVKAVRIERNKLKPTHVCTGVDLMTMSLTSNRQGAVQISNLLSIIQIHSGPCLYKRRHFMWLNSFTIKNFTPFYHNRWNLFVERIWKNFFFFFAFKLPVSHKHTNFVVFPKCPLPSRGSYLKIWLATAILLCGWHYRCIFGSIWPCERVELASLRCHTGSISPATKN